MALAAGRQDTRLVLYLALLASLPTLYWSVIAERYLQAAKRRRALMVANLTVGAIALAVAFLIETIGQAVAYYAIGLSVYAGWLLVLSRRTVSLCVSVPVIVLAPLAVQLQLVSLIYPAIYFAALLLLSWRAFRPSFADLERLKGRP